MARISKKPDLLAMAGTIVVRDGINALTLDRLATEAGISKGGLLYHFPDKERLLAALVEGRVVWIDVAIAGQIAADERSSEPGHWLRALVQIAFTADGDTQPPGVLLGILRAGLPPGSPARAALIAADGRWREAASANGLPRGLTIAVFLAVQGAAVTSLRDDDAIMTRDALLALTETAR